jgi:hypothetical protein
MSPKIAKPSSPESTLAVADAHTLSTLWCNEPNVYRTIIILMRKGGKPWMNFKEYGEISIIWLPHSKCVARFQKTFLLRHECPQLLIGQHFAAAKFLNPSHQSKPRLLIREGASRRWLHATRFPPQ